MRLSEWVWLVGTLRSSGPPTGSAAEKQGEIDVVVIGPSMGGGAGGGAVGGGDLR